jgi:hypothetical protein
MEEAWDSQRRRDLATLALSASSCSCSSAEQSSGLSSSSSSSSLPFPFDFAIVPKGMPGMRLDGINYSRVIGRAVHKKWHTAEEKEWWFTKLTLARRLKTTKLFHKQGGLCYFCGQESWLHGDPRTTLRNNRKATLEHVVTQGRGGTDHMSNLVMSCNGCNNLRGDMKFGKFLKLRRDPVAWKAYVKMKAAALQERKVKVKEKRGDAKVLFMWKIAVLLYLKPEWNQVVDEIRTHFREIEEKKMARHAKRVANSAVDMEDLA